MLVIFAQTSQRSLVGSARRMVAMVARDFQPPARAATASSSRHSGERSPSSLTKEMTAPHSAGRARPSIASRNSFASANTANLRRCIGRSNTVRTYHNPDRPNWQPGAEPGLDTTKEDDDAHTNHVLEHCDITIADYSQTDFKTREADNKTLKSALEEPVADGTVRWISVNGLSWDVVKLLANKYNLHRLAVEDLMYTQSRTKVDWYSDHAFMILTLQTLIKVCTHDLYDDCGCEVEDNARRGANFADAPGRSTARWWQRSKSPPTDGDVPHMHVDTKALTSTGLPTRKIRTLHRYESSRNPEYTSFMEKYSALAEENLVVSVEQVAIFLMANNTVISFLEHSADVVEEPIMRRLESPDTMLRRSGDASLLVQAIIDTIVDMALPVKDAYNKVRREMQIDVLTNPDVETSKSLYIFSEEVDLLQEFFKPIVNLVNALRDHQSDASFTIPSQSAPDGNRTESMADADGSEYNDMHRGSSGMHRRPLRRMQTSPSSVVITPLTRTYLGDVLDHSVSHIRSLEQMDESATNLASLIFNTVGAKTNSFMMILALVTVFFSPLTFISGYFGMNFDSFDAIHDHSDAFFWAISLPAVAVFMAAVGGKVIWSGIRGMFLRAKIKALRRERNRKQAVALAPWPMRRDGGTLPHGHGLRKKRSWQRNHHGD